MTPGARLAAAAAILDRVLAGEAAERALTNWARASRFAGSKDRAAVRDHVFDALRRRRSAAWAGGSESGRGLMIGLLRLRRQDPAAAMTGEGHALAPPGPDEGGADLAGAPRAVRLDLPDWLLPRFDASLGPASDAAAQALGARAPVTLRANFIKATRDEACAVLSAEGVIAVPDAEVATALHVAEGASKVATCRAYAEGLVELQDASSQAAVLRLPLRDGTSVLDLCAGGGGKTLAMGALARLRLHAFDVEPRRMADLRARAARAGLDVDILSDPAARGPYDLVLVDAPCSGSGTWRRAPEAKWRLTPERLNDLCRLQVKLLTRAASLVHPGGHLAFATCSVLAEEGPDRVAAFLAATPGWTLEDELRRTPGAGGDGFYQAVLARSEAD